MKLSHRLHTIYQSTLEGQPLWDVCCDHGLLGLYAYKNQRSHQVYFVDQVPSIMEGLEKLFKDRFLFQESPVKAHFITKDGGKISSPLSGTVVIAGVGGLNMKQMLLSWQESGVLSARRLILSPHRDELLYEKADFLPDYILTEQKMILEKGNLRYIFVFDLKQ